MVGEDFERWNKNSGNCGNEGKWAEGVREEATVCTLIKNVRFFWKFIDTLFNRRKVIKHWKVNNYYYSFSSVTQRLKVTFFFFSFKNIPFSVSNSVHHDFITKYKYICTVYTVHSTVLYYRRKTAYFVPSLRGVLNQLFCI